MEKLAKFLRLKLQKREPKKTTSAGPLHLVPLKPENKKSVLQKTFKTMSTPLQARVYVLAGGANKTSPLLTRLWVLGIQLGILRLALLPKSAQKPSKKEQKYFRLGCIDYCS